jgi:hypothetical protein
MEYLPRNIRIDWLRFHCSSHVNMVRSITRILGLPFEKYTQAHLHDVRETNFLALNKVWHNVYEFQNSLIGVREPDSGPCTDKIYHHFVNLNGATLAAVDFPKICALLALCQNEIEFVGNRIDIALDFPVPSDTPRLSRQRWEYFVDANLLFGYRSVKRISTFNTIGKGLGTTVYLGSRESERFVRIYDKSIDGVDYDRLEVEFKRGRANWIMQQIPLCSSSRLPEYLNDIVLGQISFTRSDESIDFFRKYKSGSVAVPASSLHLDIEKSIAYIEKHSATFAMVEEFLGSEGFDKFMQSVLAAGRLRMKPRHCAMLQNAKALLGLSVLAALIFVQAGGAIASGLSCPAPVPLSFEIKQKFPIDIVNPTPSEQAYFNNIGEGCFQINSGLNFDQICLPGMIVNALRPFVIIGLGIKFIFND